MDEDPEPRMATCERCGEEYDPDAAETSERGYCSLLCKGIAYVRERDFKRLAFVIWELIDTDLVADEEDAIRLLRDVAARH
jgi:hypothetical protein